MNFLQQDGKPTAGEAGLISIIIPALNEEKVIGKCLEALAAMDFPRSSMEVILVDNGSKDRTVAIARTFENCLNLRVLERKGVHISAMRNAGAAQARGELLAFLDADCIVSPNWLSNSARLLADPKAGVGGAHYEIPADATWVGRVWFQDRMAEKVGDVRYIPSGDLFLRRKTFFQLGGFDETIQTNEDFELCQRVLAAGFPVRSYPDLRVVHLGTPRTLKSFYRKQRWHGTHVLTVFLRDIRKGRNVRPVLFAVYTLACLVGIFGGLIAGVLGGGWKFSAIFGAALLIPILLIAIRRGVAKGQWGDILPVALMYLTFGVARAGCILDIKAWTSPWRKRSTQPSN
jgi:cellulose synthase/poly-beta-1,6-N-acetylglucosamine synthase-like glycosyltransferase